jgi:hypothetical protein
MSTRIFCNVCDKEMVLDQNPEEVDSGSGWAEFKHQQGIEFAHYDKLTDERTYEHECKSCHVARAKEESYYEENEHED